MNKEKVAVSGNVDIANPMLRMNPIWRKKYKKFVTEYIRCALLGSNQTFGEEEIINKQPQRHFRAKVVSFSADVIAIPTKVNK